MTACTYHQLCLMPFADGLFPAFMVRDQYGDKAIRADDTVLIAKVPPALDDVTPYGHIPGYAWGTWIPAPVADAPQITAASLAGSTPGPAVWHPSTPSQPWWPSEPNWPDYPCNCITTPPINPPLPEPAPVPLPASAGLLLTAVVALAWLRRRA